jgi:hypothetical protein
VFTQFRSFGKFAKNSYSLVPLIDFILILYFKEESSYASLL